MKGEEIGVLSNEIRNTGMKGEFKKIKKSVWGGLKQEGRTLSEQ